MYRALKWLRTFEPVEFPVFEEYVTAVSGLPLGSERLEWSRESLLEKDELLERVNRQFRNAVFDACFDILDRFGAAADSTRRRARKSNP